MANGDNSTVLMITPDGKRWNVPQAQVATMQQQFKAQASQAPSATKRLLTSAAGIPESTDTSFAGMKRDLPTLNDPSTWLTALKQSIASLSPVAGMREAESTAAARFSQPGVGNKIQGAGEYLESGFPYAGPVAVRSAEQTSSGDIAGGIGSALNATLLHRAPIDLAPRLATGPLRTFAQAIEGVGGDAVADAEKSHAKALADARTEYADTLRKTRETNQAADVTNVSEHRQSLDRIAAADAKADADYRAKVSRLTTEFNAGRQALAQSASLAAQLSSTLPSLRERARVAAKAAYPDIPGAVDATDVHSDLRSALDTYLKGTNRAPASIARILSETQAPADLLDQASVFRGQGAQGRAIRGVNLSDAGLKPEQLAKLVSEMDPATRRIYESSARSGVNATGKPVDFETLHGFYSELGNELSRPNLPGDERAALNAARATLLKNHMEPLADAANARPQFESAQEGWKTFKNTFDNTDAVSGGGGPLARALKTADPVTRTLRPDYVRAILSEDKAFGVAKEHLARYSSLGAPVGTLDAMKSAADAARSAPKKLTLPKAPTPTEIPAQPATALKQSPAAPPELQPSPFDPVAARRAILERRRPIGQITPSFGWRYRALRAIQNRLARLVGNDYLSQNPR